MSSYELLGCVGSRNGISASCKSIFHSVMDLVSYGLQIFFKLVLIKYIECLCRCFKRLSSLIIGVFRITAEYVRFGNFGN